MKELTVNDLRAYVDSMIGQGLGGEKLISNGKPVTDFEDIFVQKKFGEMEMCQQPCAEEHSGESEEPTDFNISKEPTLDNLMKLKDRHKQMWNRVNWDGDKFSSSKFEEVSRIMNVIEDIESQGVFAKCVRCGKEEPGVDYMPIGSHALVCQSCYEEEEAHSSNI